MTFLLLPLFILVTLAQYGWVNGRRWMVLIFGSIPGMFFTYYFVGKGMAKAIGHGRFYSLPFGGFKLTDASVLPSLGFWFVAWIIILFLLTRGLKMPRSKRSRN